MPQNSLPSDSVHDFSQLTADELRAFPPHQTVFIFPVGPLEDHGPHLPLAMDLLEAQALALRVAGKIEAELSGWRAVIMPVAPLGIESNTTALAITVRPHVIRDYLVDSCRSLIHAGFVRFICVSGHLGPKQLTAIEDASRIIARENSGAAWVRKLRGKTVKPALIPLSSALVDPNDWRSSLLWPDPAEHGGERDSSVALAIGAGAQASGTSVAALPAISKRGKFFGRALHRWQRTLSGYWGAPAQATPAAGERELARQVDIAWPKLRAVWQTGTDPGRVFKSWYSLMPLNKSFFKAWLLAGIFVVFLIAWFLFAWTSTGRH